MQNLRDTELQLKWFIVLKFEQPAFVYRVYTVFDVIYYVKSNKAATYRPLFNEQKPGGSRCEVI